MFPLQFNNLCFVFRYIYDVARREYDENTDYDDDDDDNNYSDNNNLCS
jgi:hypothetical protein